MTMLRLFLFTLAVVAATASHFSSFEGHGLHGEPKLVSQSVHLREIPTKVIKVTKTVAIKVPVPYPVNIPKPVPVPVPVAHPVYIERTKVLKVPEQVPVEVSKPVPVEIHQQVPLLIPKPVLLYRGVPVPHPVTVDKPVYLPVPHPVPYQSESHSEGGIGGYGGGISSDGDDHLGHESRYSTYTVNSEQGHGGYDQEVADQGHFQPSQPDYSAGH